MTASTNKVKCDTCGGSGYLPAPESTENTATPPELMVVAPVQRPQSWIDYVWPEWVPAAVRQQIEHNWGEFGRPPTEWMADARGNKAPELGQRVTLPVSGEPDTWATGRYVHAWNNIGRLVKDDGDWKFTYIAPRFWPPADPKSPSQPVPS